MKNCGGIAAVQSHIKEMFTIVKAWRGAKPPLRDKPKLMSRAQKGKRRQPSSAVRLEVKIKLTILVLPFLHGKD